MKGNRVSMAKSVGFGFLRDQGTFYLKLDKDATIYKFYYLIK